MNTKPKILLVEDHVHMLAALRFMLRRDYEIVEATDGIEGLDIFRKNPDAALMISDNGMPGMLGVDLIAAIKSERPEFPVILLSGDEKEPSGHKANMYLQKPFDEKGIRKAINGLIAKSVTPAP